MKINVKSLLNGEISNQSFEYEFILEYDTTAAYKEAGYAFLSPVKVKGNIKNAGGFIPLTATCTVDIEGKCARCLESVKETVVSEFSRTVAVSLEAEDEDDEYLLVSEGCIEIEEPIRDEVLLSLPTRLLCSEDCKGLCHKCGFNLNQGSCGCSNTEIDPRWAALRKFTEGK